MLHWEGFAVSFSATNAYLVIFNEPRKANYIFPNELKITTSIANQKSKETTV